MKIRLTIEEADLLMRHASTRRFLRELLPDQESHPRGYVIDIDSPSAERLREECENLLQMIGFDSDYVPTQEGRALEGLLDKLLRRGGDAT